MSVFQKDMFAPDITQSVQTPRSDRIEVRKGDLGEEIVIDTLKNNNFCNAIYKPINIDQPHGFDLILDMLRGKQILCEVKTYSSRGVYRDTGINTNHKNVYLRKQKEFGKPLFLVFVDSFEGRIYGGYLDDLLKPYTVDSRRDIRGRYPITYPKTVKERTGWKTYFSLDVMIDLGGLSDKNIRELNQLSKSTHNYYR